MGVATAGETPTLGNRALRGERGILLISPGEMLRQKWNPFYAWMEGRALEFTPIGSARKREPGLIFVSRKSAVESSKGAKAWLTMF